MTLRQLFDKLPEGAKIVLHKAPTRYALHEKDDRICRKLADEQIVEAHQGGLTEVWTVNNAPIGELSLPLQNSGLPQEHLEALRKVFPTLEKVKDLVCLMHSGYKGWRPGQGMELPWQTKRAILSALFDLGVVGEEEKYGQWEV